MKEFLNMIKMFQPIIKILFSLSLLALSEIPAIKHDLINLHNAGILGWNTCMSKCNKKVINQLSNAFVKPCFQVHQGGWLNSGSCPVNHVNTPIQNIHIIVKFINVMIWWCYFLSEKGLILKQSSLLLIVGNT